MSPGGIPRIHPWEDVNVIPVRPDGRPLSERVRPAQLADIAGNPTAIAELHRWAKGWQSAHGLPRHRAALLSGPPGTGKTSAALALAHDMGWGLVEMNASDARNRQSIEEVAGRASMTSGFSLGGELLSFRAGHRTLILLDEADCLFSRSTEAPETERRAPPPLRDFLRTRYGDVQTLSRAWGLGASGALPPFKDWNELPLSAGRSRVFRLPAAQRDVADWSATKVRTDLSDRGGLGAIAKLVGSTHQPLVLTVNDPRVLSRYSPIFRTAVTRISFWPLRNEDMKSVVRRTALSQHLQISAAAAEAIVGRSHGDLRAAINDLDAISVLPPGPAQEALLGSRDTRSDFFDFTREVLESGRLFRSVEIRNRLDATPDDLLPWIEENLPRATQNPRTRFEAFQPLAEADLLLSRARRFRAYGLWSYASELMTGGVGLALEAGHGGTTGRIVFPEFLGEMGRARWARATRAAILTKVGHLLHLSRRKAAESALPFLTMAFQTPLPSGATRRSEELPRRLAAALGLTAEELAYLTGGSPQDARIQALVHAEEERPGPSVPATSSEVAVVEPFPELSTPEAKPEPEKGPSAKKTQRRLGDY
jgi:replication factor C large subunit